MRRFSLGYFRFTDLRIDRDNGSGWLHEPETGNSGANVRVRWPGHSSSTRPSSQTIWWSFRQSVGSSPLWHNLFLGSSSHYSIRI